jgi:hypothetical protein
MTNTHPDNPELQLSLAGTASLPENGFQQKMVHVPGFDPPTAVQDNLCPLPNCSQEDLYEFRSAGVLLKALAAEARAWSEKLPENFRPAIVALLHGNLQVEVRSLAQVSFDGIRVEGVIGDNPCSVLAHQGTIQLMCYAVSTDAEEEYEHRPIGFIWPDHDESI